MSQEDEKSQRFVLTHGKKKMAMLKVELHVAACPASRSAVGCAGGSCGGVTGRRQETLP